MSKRSSSHGRADRSGADHRTRLRAKSRRRPRRALFLTVGFLIGGALAVFSFWRNRDDTTRARSVAQSTSSVTPPPMPPENAVSAVSIVELGPSDRSLTAVEQLARKQDASTDTWDTEVLSDAVDRQLNRLSELLAIPQQISAASVEAFVSSDFTCQPLRPSELSEVFRDRAITVRRAAAPIKNPNSHLRGAAGFSETLRQLMAALEIGANLRTKFKLFHIERRDAYFTTSLYCEASGGTNAVGRQLTSTWICHWSYPAPDPPQAPMLKRVDLERYEEVEITISGGRLFADCTESALAGNAAYAQQIIPGINHWLTRIPREFMGQFGHHGIAVGDVNGDGLDDLYVCDAGGLPNRLFVQQTDGTALDLSEPSGMNLLEDSLGALLIDIDNDGDQDLAVATDSLLQLAENDGTGRFTLRRGIDADTDPYSLSAADYDSDGDLDIYVCGYKANRQDPMNRGLPFPLPYHDANNGGRNYLLRNDGDFRFEDVTRSTGLDENNRRFSLAAAWEDFDNDGDVDLYVANDFGRNNLYRNDGGHFTDVAGAAGVEDHAAGMSVSWGDYNHDGRMDLYVSNMFSAAGNRVTYQRRFGEGLASQTVSHLRRMARGNTLFDNVSDNEGAAFRDTSVEAAVTMGRWAWSSKFVDLNNDGWQDLIVANGYVTNDDSGDL